MKRHWNPVGNGDNGIVQQPVAQILRQEISAVKRDHLTVVDYTMKDYEPWI
jgi:hypothetical protein